MFKNNHQRIRHYPTKPQWRSYQSALKSRAARRRAISRIPTYIFIFCIMLLGLLGIFKLCDFYFDYQSAQQNRNTEIRAAQISRDELRHIIDPDIFFNLTDRNITLRIGARRVVAETSIMPQLQQALIETMDRRHSQYIGIVAMDPDNGRILAMAGYNRSHPGRNTCVIPDFPAASLFKIVTAAAAIESCGFSPKTRVCFNGEKHTLYKSQLSDRINRYTNWTTLTRAFAESINPVFGKIGEKKLKKDLIEHYASLFGFGSRLNADFPVKPSLFSITENPYNWAEIASGFNKSTRISPLHAAVIASIIAADGIYANPSAIDRIIDQNLVIYKRPAPITKRIISPDTARSLSKLMHATVTSGTAKKFFRRVHSNPILSSLEICGKTGSINNNAEEIRFEWFSGFAISRKNGKKFAAGVVVAHKKYIGTRAETYFKKIATIYFSEQTG